ncbi:class 1/2 aminotransferase [Vitreoscilla sp. C1]|uniref:aminotransferase-like domain-containing protein n=1 Tax=Vitreoscilla sp. (strain C1) TaxID=96942 RepID=UPI00148EB0C2|nr:PLP-dependent aminotransferase family protein [Vitreoscilla sp. C1]AUZ04489.2 class 1/2 aminotransferase [Vitreoscilla sp. C1]
MTTLVDELIRTIRAQIERGQLPHGSKLPSIRQAAKLHQVSTFTVAEAYSRLNTQGCIQSEAGRGFFVSQAKTTPLHIRTPRQPLNPEWLLQGIYQSDDAMLQAGCGWLPDDWYDPELASAALRKLARSPLQLNQYGQPQGLLPLRQLLSQRWAAHHLPLDDQQVLLTQGASQALDIITATYCQAGDTVFIDSPGYTNLLTRLRSKQLNIVGVPWREDGPDVVQLAQLLQQYQPKLMFTNPVLQNPTGASYSLATAHQVLQLLKQADCLLVESQVSFWLAHNPPPPLSALDNIQNSILIGSFTKHLSPALRVGYVFATEGRIQALMQQKMLAGLTTSVISEHLALLMWQDLRSHKQLSSWRSRLSQAQHQIQQLLESLGWEVFAHASSGLFVFAKHPLIDDAYQFAQDHYQDNLTFAPGMLFAIDQWQSHPWFRFNVAFCQEHAFAQWLEQATKDLNQQVSCKLPSA